MTHYGGLGGILGGRPMNAEDRFEATLHKLFGQKIKEDKAFGGDLWSALANVDWQHADGDTASYSFRAAGDVVAALVGEGDYINWYCSSPDGVVSDYIKEALASEGWTFVILN